MEKITAYDCVSLDVSFISERSVRFILWYYYCIIFISYMCTMPATTATPDMSHVHS